MSFVVWAALGVVAFVVGPVVAHLLRRGRAEERPFPAAALVPRHTSTARKRSRLEDWPLLALRTLMIVALAVLGASPLVRCDRLTVARHAGGSVGMAIVVDDSLSMRAAGPDGASRWQQAVTGAEQLLASSRQGDAVAVVLAGRPARIALAPTTDLAAARRAVSELAPSDRPTDLPAAVQLARTAMASLPQKDVRVIVLSDLAGEPIPDGAPPALTPLSQLARPLDDCGITQAERRGARVTVSVACSSDAAAASRTVELVVAAPATSAPRPDGGARAPARRGDVVGRAELPPREGEQQVTVTVDAVDAVLEARLAGEDAMRHDDTAPVWEESTTPVVAVVADATRATAKTGGATVVEQALAALAEGWSVRPLPFVPDDGKGLDDVAALVLDDPAGISPEARATLTRFLGRGGVAIALLGRRATMTELGSTLEPFVRGAARWEDAQGLGLAADSLGWLGPEAASLSDLSRRGRLRLDGVELPGSRVVGRWSDAVPWLLEQRSGRGLILTAGLPASLEESDLALRPGFVALLDHVLRQADQRAGSRRTVAGAAWAFQGAGRVVVEGSDGPVPVTAEPSDDACAERGQAAGCGATVLRARPGIRGAYTVRVDDEEPEARLVALDPAEILAAPRPPLAGSSREADAEAADVPASREAALALIALLAAEVALRLVRRLGTRRRTGDPLPAP